ncbi:tyrosine-type recombinase/integrase [Streptomyces sp. NPDC014983]|uniref:tyrosine-type recombinase/integrase n=1 Tax=Streptomyces sp. NPDC014983 TaxID=3364933 RepID=UPI0036FAF75D
MTDMTTTASLPAPRSEDAATISSPEMPRTGPNDDLTPSDLLPLLTAHGKRLGYSQDRLRDLKLGAQGILDWLNKQPAEGWQRRWIAAGADRGLDWLNTLPKGYAAGLERRRALSRLGAISLLLNRVVLPDYDFLTAFSSRCLFQEVQRTVQPDLAAEMHRRSAAAGMPSRRLEQGMNVLAKMVLHTGKNFDQLSGEDFEHFRTWGLNRENRVPPGIFPAWDLLRSVDILPANLSFKEFCHQGQRPTQELVDRYQLRCREVRDVLIRYLDERRPSLDYPSFVALVGHLVGSFWSDIEEHHPDVASLHLPEEVATAWKERMKYVTKRRSSPRRRKSYLLILVEVRSFYLDLQEWALDDPSWAPHAVPSPVRRGETDGLQKQRRSTIAKMHQRVRERLPQLPVLVETAERHRRDQETLLAAAQATAVGETFEHAGVAYRRVIYKTHLKSEKRARTEVVLVEDPGTGETIDLTQCEDEAFWSWAVIETLRHTGIRREELLEITHLALVSYRMADSGELVPLLQIVPSKNNQERLLLVSPELASVLATIITRLRNTNGGTIPMTSRYDTHERAFGPMLPHLFQRRPRGHRNEVISPGTVQDLLDAALARTGLRDAAGEPLKFTAHDFRRMFATEAVTGGLPVHIAARLLGHEDLSTTQAYLAVFQDDLIRSYRTFLAQRRSLRPEAEYRDPTDEEWREFEQHFALRKVELGTCGRPYGTPCKHEHACVRCPMLRIDPGQRKRLIEIIHSLTDRIKEAKSNGWLGEAEGLQVSLQAASKKLTAMDQAQARSKTHITDLGLPQLRQP